MNINQANLNKHLNISYTTNDEINGIVHISHGMAEHVGRYQWLISKFNDAGYHVYA
ncbi:MAG: alpha/beta hydrolase, partial [Proteobacteria bacterium]|nr:alpha/beta hydrolase [Pseudomonadota bacterium]